MNILNIEWNSVYHKKEDMEIGILSYFVVEVVIIIIIVVFIFIYIVVLVVVVIVTIIIIIIIIIIIHFPYYTAVKLVLKRILVSMNKHFLITVPPKTF